MRMVFRKTTDSLRRDDGTVLLWIVGCAAIALMVIAASAQVAVGVHQKRLLQYATDRAALAAANDLDVSTFRLSGDVGDVQIARDSARATVLAELALESFNIRLEFMDLLSDQITVRTSTTFSSQLTWGVASSERIYAETTAQLSQLP